MMAYDTVTDVKEGDIYIFYHNYDRIQVVSVTKGNTPFDVVIIEIQDDGQPIDNIPYQYDMESIRKYCKKEIQDEV